jgi:2-succinyl-5-enolpyruvyl-6-hydroxy-3-cyclohexene-1-carboxylate synthase
MNLARQAIADLVEICFQKGIQKVVISPGSRNAPIADCFLRKEGMDCISIVDERSAGFFALGMAQQLQSPVALLCTSGSAVLNYAPAIVEAYYQRIPLVVITADRPQEWIDQGESQTINQQGIFSSYVVASFQLPQNPVSKNDCWYHNRQVAEAINRSTHPKSGPVHLNIALDEPLYTAALATSLGSVQPIRLLPTTQRLDHSTVAELCKALNTANKVMVLVGMQHPDEQLNALLTTFASSAAVIVLTETNSNLTGQRFFNCIDKVLAPITVNEVNDFQPDLLITFGQQVISKKIKAFLRNARLKAHWNIDPSGLHTDTYQQLSHCIPVSPHTFFEQINMAYQAPESRYFATWDQQRQLVETRHQLFLNGAPFSDLTAFQKVLSNVPEGSLVQMGNSSTVRYIQLFNQNNKVTFYGNRGTSGIEGSSSTAVGASWVIKKTTTLIVGDLSFLYDQNALWNNYLTPFLKIIVINNSGGGIFRFIDGPSTVKDFETYLETTHNRTVTPVAQMHGLPYFYAENEQQLDTQLPLLYNEQRKTAILEIKTPRMENANILKSYFHYLTHGK